MLKRELQNRCEGKFKECDIYTEWKSDKMDNDNTSLTGEKMTRNEEVFAMRRMQIKQKMLGNIKFSK